MKLYSLNTPCWSDYDPKNTAGSELIKNPLSDHFTYMFYNFMKYGPIDEVYIFLDQKRIDRGIVQKTINTDCGKMTIFDKSSIETMSLEDKQMVYCWSGWKDCKSLSNNFVIVNPMFSDILYPSQLEVGIHDYALIEGKCYEKTVPKEMPFEVFRYTSYDFCQITDKERIDKNREYDWILVSSFDPRKRHIEFLKQVLKNSEAKKTKGCIVGRNPDNKKVRNNGHRVLETVRGIIHENDLDVDIFLNCDQSKKRELMLSSKIYICPSSLDNGPRSMIEAAQAGCVLLSGDHIGSSCIIKKDVNGQTFRDLSEVPELILNTIRNYKTYDINYSGRILLPENVYPSLMNNLMEKYHDKFK